MFAEADAEDRILAYVRYAGQGALLIAHNFDPCAVRNARYRCDYLPRSVEHSERVFDSYEALGVEAALAAAQFWEGEFALTLMPLQTQVWRLY